MAVASSNLPQQIIAAARSDKSGNGAVKITLHSANADIDEKAEVTVALSNPEAAVEKMLHTLALRFPPESIMTIQPTSGAAGSTSSPSEGVTEEGLTSSSYQSSVRHASGLSPEIRSGISSLPPAMTSIILATDPALLPELLDLASQGGDVNHWASRRGLDPVAMSSVVTGLQRDPAFRSWVEKLARATKDTHHRRHKHRKDKGRGKRGYSHESNEYKRVVGTPETGTGYSDPKHLESRNASYQQAYIDPYISTAYPSNGAAYGVEGDTIAYNPTAAEYNTETYNTHPPVPSPARVYHQDQISPTYHPPSTGGYQASTGYPSREYATGEDSTARMNATGLPAHLTPGFGEYVEVLPDGSRIRYIEKDVVTEKVIMVPKPDGTSGGHLAGAYSPNAIGYPNNNVSYPNQPLGVEEEPEIEWVTREKSVEQIVWDERRVPKIEYVEVPKVEQRQVEKLIPRQVEKVIEVPQIVEREVPYSVPHEIPVPRYINVEQSTVVAQKLRPIVRESKRSQKVPTKTYEPVLYSVDVYVPKPILGAFTPTGKVGESHKVVEIPAPQYNSLLTNMNQGMDPNTLQDLLIRGTGGVVPMLPPGELADIVPPLPTAFQSHTRVARHKKHDKSHRH